MDSRRRPARRSVPRHLPRGQLLATALGGFVGRLARPEVGAHDVFLTEAGKHDPLFAGLPGRFQVLGWHEDAFALPRRAIPLAGSIAYEHQAYRFGANAYGLQFHPEVRLDDLGGWATVPGYAGLLERAGADWGEVRSALEQAAPELDTLAEELLERWLYLVAGVARAARATDTSRSLSCVVDPRQDYKREEPEARSVPQEVTATLWCLALLGTGGGAIAVAIAHKCPNVEVWATDTSRSAVQLARANVRRHRLEDRVFVRQCDLLDEVPAPVDLIVANLPYVPESTAAEHPDLLVEPFESVFATGDGLGPYRRLVHGAADWLADDGELLLQLHRQIFAATRAELSALSAALDASSSGRELSAL
ncbi:MAG: methyltransferase [Gaiellaceae bacterium]